MKTLLTILLFFSFITPVFAEKNKSTFTSDLGFSIQSPVAVDNKIPVYQVAIFFLPMSNGFSANVNIQRQEFNSSLEEYDKISMGQFKDANMSILKHTIKDNILIYEYTGNMNDRSLHWYSKAVKSGKYVFLVTATALDDDWNKQKSILLNSIDSFILK